MDAVGAALDTVPQLLHSAAHEILARNETSTKDPDTATRPPVFKVIGICLAIGSGLFIGTSFVLKKVGLLKANDKYNEQPGEGYGYLKNAFWWGGMTLMILGEVLNFVAYAFTDAILVTPLGALSVVITTILSAIFLKERLSMIGKVACFLCIIGSVVIVMNAPENSSVADIQEMQHYVIAPGFLSYTGVVIVGSAITAFWAGPRWGKKNMFVYISICSWVGGLSVVATQGLGSAIVAQAQGHPQFNQWFLYVLLVFVVGTLLTEIIFLNKALNLFNAAMVTPTYYVYFTSTTIITSAVLFRGFKGSATSIVTVVMGFLTICSGVVLLQLSKSAKDVPDAAVFSGDLDQIHTIAEQEQPETEPKADAIRGAAALLRRFSNARQRMEVEELRRLHEEKLREGLEPLSEDGQPLYEWDGLRRRKTVLGSQRSRALTSPSPNPFVPHPYRTPTAAQTSPQIHPPLGWSHFPTEEELAERDRPGSSGALSSIVGTIRGRAKSIVRGHHDTSLNNKPLPQSPMHPVQLTEISVPAQKAGETPAGSPYGNYGLPSTKTAYGGAGDDSVSVTSSTRRIQWGGDNRQVSQGSDGSHSLGPPPTPPPHGGTARRQFSFQNVFKRHQQHSPVPHHDGIQEEPRSSQDHPAFRPQSRPGTGRLGLGSRGYSGPQVKGATEEERLGLVKGDSSSNSLPTLQQFGEDDSIATDDSITQEYYADDKEMESRYGRGITYSPPRRGSGDGQPAGGSGSREDSGSRSGQGSSGEEYLQQLREQRKRERETPQPSQQPKTDRRDWGGRDDDPGFGRVVTGGSFI